MSFWNDILNDLVDYVGERFDGYTSDEVQVTPDVMTFLLDSAGEHIEDYLSDEKQVLSDIKMLGAGLVGKDARLTVMREEQLYRFGQALAERLEAMQKDLKLKREQQQHISTLRKRQIFRLQQLQEMDPFDFEYWVASYFKRRRFRQVVVTPPSVDFGIDIYMRTQRGLPAVVQVKRYHHAVGRPVVQQTYGAMKLVGAKRCFVVTSGAFTRTAYELAEQHNDIILIDGRKLVTATRKWS